MLAEQTLYYLKEQKRARTPPHPLPTCGGWRGHNPAGRHFGHQSRCAEPPESRAALVLCVLCPLSVFALTIGSGTYEVLRVSFFPTAGMGGLGVARRCSGLAARPPLPCGARLTRNSADWATPIGDGGRPAEPKPSSTPHLALEHEPGGPNMSQGSPGKTLPGRRAPLYQQRTPLSLSTDWAAPN